MLKKSVIPRITIAGIIGIVVARIVRARRAATERRPGAFLHRLIPH